MEEEAKEGEFLYLVPLLMEIWRKNLYVLWGTQFLAMIGMNLVVPFLPFYVRTLGITDESELAQWSGLIFAAPFFTSFIATPFWGSLGDRYGKKLMVTRALFGLGISQILIGFSQDVYQLFLFRMFQGAISGFIAAALALVSTSTPKQKIGYALGFLQSATAGGSVLGPAVGGILADMISYPQIFFITSVICFIGAGVVVKMVHEDHHPSTDERSRSVFHNFRTMFSNPQLRVIAVGIVLAQAAALMVEPIFALFVESFRTDTAYLSTLTGITFAISGIFMVISAPWWGKRNDRLGYKHNLMLATAGTGVAYGLHIVVPGLITLGILRAGLGFVRGGILHALFSLTSLHAPDDRKSGLIGVASSLAVLGNMVGPTTGGMIAGQFGIWAVFACISMMFFILTAVIWRYLTDIPIHEEHGLTPTEGTSSG